MCNRGRIGDVVLCVVKMWLAGVFSHTHTMCNAVRMGDIVLCVIEKWLAGVLRLHILCVWNWQKGKYG